MVSEIEHLRHTALFNGLPETGLEELARTGHRRAVPEGSFFFFQGDPAERIFVLLDGRIKLTQSSADGQQVLLRIAGPDTLFGGVALASAETYPVSAEAAEDCVAISWPKPTLMAMIERYPALAMNAMRLMAAHAQETQERYRQMATERVERRLARTLLRLASQTGKKTSQGVLIDLALTRQDLAEMSGTTLYTVSRILSAWETKGLVLLGRERVTIRYPHGLVSIAEDLTASGEDAV